MVSRRKRITSTSALLTLALGAGCAVDAGTDTQPQPADETVAEQDEGLVGGTATLLYPEIGQFWRAPAAGSTQWFTCTATLFANRYVITAAHCINYTDISVHSGDFFRITDALGSTHDYPVDKIASYGNTRYEYVPGTSLTTDIAILRLSTPVPSSVAVPRALSSSLPANGTRVSTYGYGCTERVNKTGGGYKQFFPWNYGDATVALCPGDSGGPALFGDWLNAGQIWGINSDYTGSGSFPTWTDLFAHVPYMKPRIAQTTRQWEAHDFNGDGKSDVLWHNPTTGQISAWLLDGGVNAVNHIEASWSAPESTGWRAVGSGDFNNDGNSDVLWWNTQSGALSMWLLDGAGKVLATQDPPGWRAPESTGWKVVGTGDFNGDGNTDVVWWHGGSGEVNPWYLDGRGNVIGNGAFSWRAAASSNWKPVGTGDFNRDGAMDLLWHNTVSGQISYWQMDYAGHVQAGPLLSWTTSEAGGWKIVGTGDYNGDNKIDILWHHTSGQLSAWYVDNTTVTGHGEVNWWTSEAQGWKIVGR